MATDGYQAANNADEVDDLFGGDDLFGEGMPDESTEMSFLNDFEAPAAAEDEEEMAALKLAMGEGLIADAGGDDMAGAEQYLREREGEDLAQEEKAADAIDFEDISDDDLPEEEYTEGGSVQQPPILAGIEDVAMGGGDFYNDDDLFGPSSPMQEAPDGQDQFLYQHDRRESQDVQDEGQDAADSDLASEHEEESTSPTRLPEVDEVEDAQWLLQRQLFAQSGTGVAPETEKENYDEWLKLEFPSFSRDEVPYFNQLFPPKPARWVGKAPLKPPKPIRPNKVNLEIEQDQKAMFNSSVQTLKRSWEDDGNVVVIEGPQQAEEEEDSADESDPDEPLPGGLTMQDLDVICADFDTLSTIAESDYEAEHMAVELENDDASMFGYDDFNDFEHPVKKRKTGMSARDIVSIYHLPMPSFDDPEKLTKKIARKVILDLNDPQLLVEEVDHEVARARARPGENVKGAGSLKDRLTSKFNLSNDADYDMLKQNHANKVRAQLSTINVEHSVPALRLQFPYYKVKMPVNEMRNFHRKKLDFRYLGFGFEKPDKTKRKHQKGKTVKELYDTTKKLSLADNSHSLLLEYSEEHPMMLSQTGMGNKVVNYYKRKTADDSSRPKGDIGDTNVLLLEDRSPFSMFGKIEPGETITAIHNSMYRAPIFKQNLNHEDFLVIREHTGMGGSQHYLRNVDHIYTVGQELPFVHVPGPHSRAVTTAAKNRLKAISFRIARRKKHHRIRVEDVTRHFPDTTDMQNRQKMKEFMTFSKEHKEWEMKPGEVLPDEDHIQTLLTPEYISLLESMQVGQQYLADAGFGGEEDDEDDEKEGENQTIEQELAPWKTTKNFLNATQGKAMLTLYGDGDPSGRGEAFSFIKTSMKGGFKAKGAPINDMLTDADKKKLGGHSYNVAAQQREYDNSIKAIWDKQKRVLSSDAQASEDEDGVDDQDDSVIYNGGRGRSVTSTPAPARRRDDETATSFSKRSTTSQAQRFLKITRTFTNHNGDVQTEDHIETNPTVIKNYLKARQAKEEENMEYVHFIVSCALFFANQ
jgi:transcription initiation factor TFIID subunit 1, fungi type